MRIPKPVTALKALLLGIPVTLPDGVTYEYVQAVGDDRKKVWATGTCVESEHSADEKVLLDSSMTLNEFILECERMTELQWVMVCASVALTMERLQRQEKRERRSLQHMVEENDFVEIQEELEARQRAVSGTELKVARCSICGGPQFETPSGICCKNGHGGAPSKEKP